MLMAKMMKRVSGNMRIVYAIPDVLSCKPMIKAVFFDFDGVLTLDGTGSLTTCTNIQKHIPDVSFDHILQCYRAHHPALLLGQTTHAAIWKEFCACVGKDSDISILDEAFRNVPMNEEMMDVCRKLQGKYTLGIITDNSKERLDVLRRDLKLADLFSIIVVSGETGLRKKGEETFMQTLALAKCDADECVFIDNSADNLIAPKKLGWHTIFHDDTKNDMQLLKSELQKLGVAYD